MANFNVKLTAKGRLLLADVQAGAELDATRLAIGSGYIPVGKTAETMTALVAEEASLDIVSKERTPDGYVIYGGYFSGGDFAEEFYYREVALFARAIYRDENGAIISTGDEMLYAYGNSGDDADLITDTTVERLVEIVSYVGNDTAVNVEIASGIYVTHGDFDSHASQHAKGGKDAITPADIGAAPDGFGLGTYATSADDANDISASGFYITSINVPEDAGLCYILHQQIDAKNASQFAITHASPTKELTAFRSKYNGTWTTWKWFNPQMKSGKEYITAERIGDKFVHKQYINGVIQYRLDGETEWKDYAQVVGAALAGHTHTPASIGAVSKAGDTVNGDLNVNGAFVVERSDNARKARTVVHNNADKEADFQNFTDDSNYVGIRLATEAMGAGDAAKLVHMKNGSFASFTLLHAGNKEKIFTSGTEELEPGVSPLGTGQLHFTYE